MNELDYQRAVRALPRSIEPARDLWPGIAARLPTAPPARSARGWLPLAIAASVFGLGFVAGWQVLNQRIEWQTPELAAAGSERSWSVREAAALRVQFDAAVLAEPNRRARPGPQEAALRVTLTELERQADQIEQAIRIAPASTFLLQRLRRLEQTRLRLSRHRFDV